MNKLKTITIGIPAYNEERSIGALLRLMCKQSQFACNISRIIVYSDGSTDKTVNEARSIKDSRIKVIDSPTRGGKAVGLNSIFAQAQDDIVVILDADVTVDDDRFLEKLVSPIVHGKADLTGAKIREKEVTTLVQKALLVSMKIKTSIFEALRSGNNVYTCHGRARAFSRKLYKTIVFQDSPSEDAYSYLFCIQNKMKYAYAQDAHVFYSLPKTLADHKKQSIRYFHSKEYLKRYFGNDFLQAQYAMPSGLIFPAVLFNALRMPIEFFLYVCMLGFLRVNAFVEPKTQNTWEVATSAK